MLTSLVTVLFGCRHSRTTFPLTRTVETRPASSGTFVTCLECGKEFNYDWQKMRVGEAVLPRQMPQGEHQIDRCARSVAVGSVRVRGA